MDDQKTKDWGSHPEMFGPRHGHRSGMMLRQLEGLRPGARVLEGAVGLGQLAVRIERAGYRAFGIDTTFEALLHVRRAGEIPVLAGDMTRLPFRDGVFDAVTSGETLEHLKDDVAAAREMERVLRPDGRCVITVPALDLLWNASDDFNAHERRYSRSSLRAIFLAAGFDRVRARFWGFPFVLLYDWLFLLPMDRRRARREVSGDAPLQSVARAGRSRLLVLLVRAVFRIDGLFSWIPFGPGLLLVARKR